MAQSFPPLQDNTTGIFICPSPYLILPAGIHTHPSARCSDYTPVKESLRPLVRQNFHGHRPLFPMRRCPESSRSIYGTDSWMIHNVFETAAYQAQTFNMATMKQLSIKAAELARIKRWSQLQSGNSWNESLFTQNFVRASWEVGVFRPLAD